MNLEPIRRAIKELDPKTGVEWEPYFNHHGDPFVVEKGRQAFGTIASIVIDTHPPDYGRTLANYVATVDPATVTRLCGEIDRLQQRVADMKRMVNGCPLDTDRDGNCGRWLCPFCGEDYQ